MSKRILEEVVGELSAAKKTIRCDELATQLRRLGFEVRDGKQGGHKVFVHDGVQGFTSGSYNCGHGRNPEILPPYIGKVLRILRQHEVEILDYLEKQK